MIFSLHFFELKLLENPPKVGLGVIPLGHITRRAVVVLIEIYFIEMDDLAVLASLRFD